MEQTLQSSFLKDLDKPLQVRRSAVVRRVERLRGDRISFYYSRRITMCSAPVSAVRLTQQPGVRCLRDGTGSGGPATGHGVDGLGAALGRACIYTGAGEHWRFSGETGVRARPVSVVLSPSSWPALNVEVCVRAWT
jgi:hypothetical protein